MKATLPKFDKAVRDSTLPVSHSRSPIPHYPAHRNCKNCRPNQPLPKWSNFGRRTPRKAPRRVSDSSSGAGDLVALGNRETGQQILPPKKRRLELPILSDAENVTGSTLNEVKDDTCNMSSRGENSMKGSGKEEFILGKDETDFQNQYVCKLCRSSFKSYQALGGHKTHHSMKGDKLMNADEFPYNDMDSVDAHVEERYSTTSEHGSPSSRRACSKGQAFGGHKQHYKESNPQDAVTRIEEVKEPENHNRVFDFDLNEHPPEFVPEEKK